MSESKKNSKKSVQSKGGVAVADKKSVVQKTEKKVVVREYKGLKSPYNPNPKLSNFYTLTKIVDAGKKGISQTELADGMKKSGIKSDDFSGRALHIGTELCGNLFEWLKGKFVKEGKSPNVIFKYLG